MVVLRVEIDPVEVVHIIQRGPRAGHEDVHIIDFKSKFVYSDKTGSRYRLTSVYSTPTIVDKSTATTDTLIAKLKSERKLSKFHLLKWNMRMPR